MYLFICTMCVHTNITYLHTLDCPEDFTLGILWERSLTKTTYKHKCSDIHPSFKFADTVTRYCMKNRTWAPVDISQCVMDSDSPVIMIVVINLGTDNSSLVQSMEDTITEQVRLKIYFPFLASDTQQAPFRNISYPKDS